MPNDVIGKDLPKEEFVMYLRGYDVKPVHAEVLMDKIEPYFDRKGNTFCSHQHAPSSGKVGSPEVTIWNNALYFSHPVLHCTVKCGKMVQADGERCAGIFHRRKAGQI